MAPDKFKLSDDDIQQLIDKFKARFNKNQHRHTNFEWAKIEQRLVSNPEKLWTVHQMEQTGGEPDIVGFDEKTEECIIMDCSPESPKGRRSLCYDRQALEERKEYKPQNSAVDMAEEMGIELLTEDQYHDLQKLGPFDTKTSSWLKTPESLRNLDGALFGDYRYGRVFIYHNGAQSYYAARGFRGMVRV